MHDWGDDDGSRWTVRLRCANIFCGEYRNVWRSQAVSQYGAVDYEKSECPECGQPGEDLNGG